MEELISQNLGFGQKNDVFFLISPTEKLDRNTSPEELCQQFQRQQRWKKSTRKVCKGLNHDDKDGVEDDVVGEGDALDSCNNANNDDFERTMSTNI